MAEESQSFREAFAHIPAAKSERFENVLSSERVRTALRDHDLAIFRRSRDGKVTFSVGHKGGKEIPRAALEAFKAAMRGHHD